MSDEQRPKRGDVESIDFADPDPAVDERAGPFGRIPAPDERVAIRLHEHPYTYIVRVVTSGKSGPKLTELTVLSDAGHAVDHAAVRAVPVRRLAYSARQWISSVGGLVTNPGHYYETDARPELADPRLAGLEWRIEQAIMDGDPVRRTVAASLNVSTATLDRLIAKARAEGLLTIAIPRRPSPRQRDALIARHKAEQWLDSHGPHATPPPELLAEIRRLSGDDQRRKEPRR